MKLQATFTSLSILTLMTLASTTPLMAHESKLPSMVIPAGDMALPPNAQPGKCYARVFEEPQYRTETVKLLKKEASEQIKIIPAQYKMMEEKVLIRPAYEKEVSMPAVYETATEKILVKPASTRWKKGRGLVEKVNNFTGEIMCLEEIPAEYRTVTRQVVKTPAMTKLIPVPAEYKTVMVNKLVTQAKDNRIAIPAEYQTITKTYKDSEGQMVWKEVLCETNAPHLTKTQTKIQKTPMPNTFLKPIAKPKASVYPIATSYPLTKSQLSAPKDEKDWFFWWDYDELFDNGNIVPAHK